MMQQIKQSTIKYT